MFRNFLTVVFILIHPLLNAGSLIKVDITPFKVLNEVLEKTRSEFEAKFPINFKRLSYSPSLPLLFLSAKNDDVNFEANENSNMRPAEIIKNVALKVAQDFGPLKLSSQMHVIFEKGNDSGVPSQGIAAGSPYYSVLIVLPEATDALAPLASQLEEHTFAAVSRNEFVRKYPFRVQMLVGYVVGEELAEDFTGDVVGSVDFDIKNIVLDFPSIDGLKNLEIELGKK